MLDLALPHKVVALQAVQAVPPVTAAAAAAQAETLGDQMVSIRGRNLDSSIVNPTSARLGLLVCCTSRWSSALAPSEVPWTRGASQRSRLGRYVPALDPEVLAWAAPVAALHIWKTLRD